MVAEEIEEVVLQIITYAEELTKEVS